MNHLTVIVVNRLLALTTPWHCIEEATDCHGGSCLVDCPALGQSVADLAPGFGQRTIAACEVAVMEAGSATRRALSKAWADIGVLDFTGSATIAPAALGRLITKRCS